MDAIGCLSSTNAWFSMVVTLQPGTQIQDGGQWMARPSSCNNIPAGLEYLSLVDKIKIKQKHELLEIALGFESKNKYVIMNGAGQQIYYAYEESGCCTRQCCGTQRGFTIHVVDNYSKEVIRIVREFQCIAGSCSCCAIPGTCCSQSLTVEAPPGNVVGTVNQRMSCCTGKYEICEHDGEAVLYCEGPPPCAMTCCCDKVFELSTTSGTTVGAIRKEWSGILRETFTDSDVFGVNFPMDLAVRTKATLIGATFLIDFMHFEDSEQQ